MVNKTDGKYLKISIYENGKNIVIELIFFSVI